MSAQPLISEAQRAQIALYRDPYLFLELEEAREDQNGNPAGLKRTLAEFHNPYIFEDTISDSDESSIFTQVVARTSQEYRSGEEDRASNDPSKVLDVELGDLLDDVLRLYQPFVARNQWAQVKEYRPEFLREASLNANRLQKVVDGLRALKFQLNPGERVECNRGPAQSIIAELKRLLS